MITDIWVRTSLIISLFCHVFEFIGILNAKYVLSFIFVLIYFCFGFSCTKTTRQQTKSSMHFDDWMSRQRLGSDQKNILLRPLRLLFG